jgi:hypothetical protein
MQERKQAQAITLWLDLGCRGTPSRKQRVRWRVTLDTFDTRGEVANSERLLSYDFDADGREAAVAGACREAASRGLPFINVELLYERGMGSDSDG